VVDDTADSLDAARFEKSLDRGEDVLDRCVDRGGDVPVGGFREREPLLDLEQELAFERGEIDSGGLGDPRRPDGRRSLGRPRRGGRSGVERTSAPVPAPESGSPSGRSDSRASRSALTTGNSRSM